MHASERWLRERGVPKVNLMVRTTNSAVVVFYESLGYYEDGEVVVWASSSTSYVQSGRERCRQPILSRERERDKPKWSSSVRPAPLDVVEGDRPTAVLDEHPVDGVRAVGGASEWGRRC